MNISAGYTARAVSRLRPFVLLAALAGLLSGCAAEQSPLVIEPSALPSPAAPGAGEPFLSVSPSGTAYMSWFEPAGEDRHAFRFARLDGDAWSEPVTIAEGDSFFVNWADFPTLLPLSDERLVAHYPWMSGAGTYSYDVVLRVSEDGGATWRAPFRPHTDGTATEHGFVSMVPDGGGVRAVWLDGRNFAGAGGGHGDHGAGADMTVRSARIRPDGGLSEEAELDPRACDCCQTAAAVTSRGVVVAYRDRSDDEVRDISLVRYENGAWTDPYPLHADGWQIAGCPVNGAALDAAGDQVVAAWFTMHGDSGRVFAAFSDDGGASFTSPIRLDEGDPIGRVDAIVLEDGSALVSWVEAVETGARVRLRHVLAAGTTEAAVTLAETSSSRASGFPRLVRQGSRVLAAWTQAGDPARIHVAQIPLP